MLLSLEKDFISRDVLPSKTILIRQHSSVASWVFYRVCVKFERMQNILLVCLSHYSLHPNFHTHKNTRFNFNWSLAWWVMCLFMYLVMYIDEPWKILLSKHNLFSRRSRNQYRLLLRKWNWEMLQPHLYCSYWCSMADYNQTHTETQPWTSEMYSYLS